jgi:hypothetical protein
VSEIFVVRTLVTFLRRAEYQSWSTLSRLSVLLSEILLIDNPYESHRREVRFRGTRGLSRDGAGTIVQAAQIVAQCVIVRPQKAVLGKSACVKRLWVEYLG